MTSHHAQNLRTLASWCRLSTACNHFSRGHIGSWAGYPNPTNALFPHRIHPRPAGHSPENLGLPAASQGRRDQNAATNGESSHSERERKDMGSCVCRPSQNLIHSFTPGSSTPGPVRGHIAATSCLPLCLSVSLSLSPRPPSLSVCLVSFMGLVEINRGCLVLVVGWPCWYKVE